MVLKKKHLKIFIYMIIAYFVGLAVILYDFSVSYAASFDPDVTDSDFHYYEKNEKSGFQGISSIDQFPDTCDGKYPDLSSCGTKYTEYFKVREYQKDSFVNYQEDWCSVASDSEMVAYINCSAEQSDLDYEGYSSSNLGCAFYGIVSLSRIYALGNNYRYDSDTKSWNSYNGWHYVSGYIDFFNPRDIYTSGDSAANVSMPAGIDMSGFMTGKMKVFNSFREAVLYLKTGDTSGLAWQGAAPKYDGDNIYLDNFEMWVHDSNAYSAYYLEFKYTIPEQLRDAASLQLDIAESFEWTSCSLADSIRKPYTYEGTNYIDLLQNPTGFKLYLDDIDSIQKFLSSIQLTHHQRAVLGSETVIDTSALSIGAIGGETLMRITNSKLYLTCYVVANNTYGQSVSGSVDFISGANGIGTYTPNASGEYKYNGDYKSQGHYETEVTIDDSGNQQYTYYYYSTDNSKKEITAKDSHDNTFTSISPPSGGSSGSVVNNITMPDHIFVNLSGSGGSGGGSDIPDVTIEDDDLTFDSLRDSIKDGYGLIDDTDTAAKGDGLVAMLSDLFGYLPAKFVGLIMLGTSSVVGIAILRMIFKR